MTRLLIASAALLTLAACAPTTGSGGDNVRLDSTGTHYETVAPEHPVADSMRNSTTNASSDRMSGRYPVGKTTGSNPY